MRFATLFLAACIASTPADLDGLDESAAHITGSALGGEAQGAVLASLIGDTPATLPDDAQLADAARALADSIPSRFSPAGCATATAADFRAHVVLDDCRVADGQPASGELTITVESASNGVIDANVDSTTLALGDVTLVLRTRVHADRAVPGVAVTSDSMGRVTGGAAFSVRGDYTAVLDGSCARATGRWADDGGLDLAATLSLCTAGCLAGTTENVRQHFTVTYDGTTTARWSDTVGDTGDVYVPCAAATAR